MSQNYFKNISNRTSPTNLHLRSQTPQYIRLIVNKNPRLASAKLLHKKSVKEILPKYLLHVNSQVQKQKLLHDIQQENLKLRKQFSLKKSLQKKLTQKFNPHQPKLQIKKSKLTFTRKNSSLSKNMTSSSSQMNLLAQRSQQNAIRSINDQILALEIKREKNDKKIHCIKQSYKYTRFIENQSQKQACLIQLKQMRENLKKLRLQMRNMRRAHIQKKNLKIKQLLMQGEIQNSIQRENIELYNCIEQIKQQIMNVSSKKASMVIKRQKLLQQIQVMKEMYDIPVEVIEGYYNSLDARKNLISSLSQSQSKFSHKVSRLDQKKEMSLLKEQEEQQQEQDSIEYDCQQNYVQNQNQGNNESLTKQLKINQQKQEEQIKRRLQQRKTIEQLQKKYFNNNDQQNYDEDYESQSQENHQIYEDNQQNNSQQYQKEDHFESASQQQNIVKDYQNIYVKNQQYGGFGHFGTAKINHQQIYLQKDTKFNKKVRGLSF